jgi:hypothetical protein
VLLRAGADAQARLGGFKLTEFAGRFASDTQQVNSAPAHTHTTAPGDAALQANCKTH